MDLDVILHDVGEYGKYQKLMLWFVLLPSHLPFGIHYYSQIFMSLTPHHWCRESVINPDMNVTYRPLTMWSRSDEFSFHPTISECYVPGNGSQTSANSNVSSQLKCTGGYEYDKRELFEENSIITAFVDVIHAATIGLMVKSTKLWLFGWDPDVDSCYSVCVLGLLKGFLAYKWNLVCDLAWLPSMALGIFFFGAFVGQWLYILVMNRFGRRMSFFSFLAIQCLCGIITAFAPDMVYFIVLRFFVGITSSAVVTSPSELAKELVGPMYRKQISILSQASRSLGLLFLSIMVFLVRDWSHIALVTTLPFLAFFLYWWVFPESPDWLKEKGRYEEVGRIFEVIAQANGRELTPEYIINLKRRFRIEGSMLEERRKNGTETKFTYWDLFHGPYTSKKTTAIIFIWFTSTTATVGLSLYSFELEGDLYLNFFVSAGAEFAAAAFVGVFRNRCGRRCSFCLSSALGGALTLSIATTQTGTNSRLTMFAVAKLSISFSSVVLPLWTGELLPIVVRSIGMRLVDLLSVIGPVALPFLYNQGRKTPGVPLLTLGSLQIAGAVVALLLPETIHQKPLQTLQDGEEFGKHRTWSDYFRLGPPKQEMKNGILKNRGPQPQSPILSLLRRQDSLRRASSEGEQDHSDPQSESSTDQGSFVETVKITVV